MSDGMEKLREVVDRMLAPVDARGYKILGHGTAFTVTIAGTQIPFEPDRGSLEPALERLAAAIESRIAFDRAHAMLAAVGETSERPPLWLVTGSNVLARWLAWSRAENAFRKILAITDELGAAPVAGYLDRRARHELSQGGARIRVRAGLAVAERIELAGRFECIASFGQEARITIAGPNLPESVITALAANPLRNDRRSLEDIVEHPFIAEAGLKLAGIRNEADTVVIDVASEWGPLAPVPAAAWRVLPHDADFAHPWRATAREIAALYELVDKGRGHANVT